MPLPIIADVFQSVLVWTSANAPRPATNILHWYDNTGTQSEANLNTDLAANVVADMWKVVSNTARVSTINITKLDGTSAGQAFSIASAAKWTGSATGNLILQGAAVLSLKTAQRGPRGRNRAYLPFVGEDQQTDGTLDATNVGLMVTAWGTFVNAMATAGWNLSAVSGVHSDSHTVNSLTVRPYLKTQRRRARR